MKRRSRRSLRGLVAAGLAGLAMAGSADAGVTVRAETKAGTEGGESTADFLAVKKIPFEVPYIFPDGIDLFGRSRQTVNHSNGSNSGLTVADIRIPSNFGFSYVLRGSFGKTGEARVGLMSKFKLDNLPNGDAPTEIFVHGTYGLDSKNGVVLFDVSQELDSSRTGFANLRALVETVTRINPDPEGDSNIEFVSQKYSLGPVFDVDGVRIFPAFSAEAGEGRKPTYGGSVEINWK